MDTLRNIAWYAFCVVWAFGAFTGKRTRRSIPGWALLLHAFVLCVGIALLFPALHRGFLGWRFLPDRRWVDEITDVLGIAGFALAIWARLYIGRNWSAGVTLKEDHALVQTGPYTLVRHPIYTGLLLVVLAKAIDQGKVGGLLAFLVLLFEWKRKSLMEERLMLEQFGAEYKRYRQEVKGLIPYVW